ncbi:uncharacterized protein LOC134283570 [Saccostrea cucullata]|uniref:uncharacterized protein LOC134283570 n=1 Tax=Saccostrea cuccullata TaxID=36930 RepID=UPI002ED0529C
MAVAEINVSNAAQHFIECDIEECGRNCEFYCNLCHQRLCKQCRDEHLKSPGNKNHEVVLYQQRQRHVPVEKCKIHPNKEKEMLCEECQIPVCSRCVTQREHRGHTFTDLEIKYEERYADFQEELSKTTVYFLPTSKDLQKEIKKDVQDIKDTMTKMKTSMKTEGESLKSLVDTVVCENMKEMEKIEHSLLDDLNTQDKTIDDYITYLNNLKKELHKSLSSTEPQKLMSEKKPKIRSIPETTKPATPGFTAGQYNKSDVTKLLGKMQIPGIKAVRRKIKPMEIREIRPAPRPITASASVIRVREFKVRGVNRVFHIIQDQLERLWISDSNGNLVQADLQGNVIRKIRTNGSQGYHTVTQDGELIFTDGNMNTINGINQNDAIFTYFNTSDWVPLGIHSSHINGDLLVGMTKSGKAKVTRYNKTGEELQTIQRDNNGDEIYDTPHYITENMNGDICTSDSLLGVVVVNKFGRYRFLYRVQESKFRPYGICTDALSQILVCDGYSNTVHLLDQDGQFLSLLLTPQHGVKNPLTVCVDDANNLYVGQDGTQIVAVYSYLQ